MANTYQGYDLAAFDRLASTTMADHIRDVEAAHLRNYPLPAQLQAAGRIATNLGGRGFDWPLTFRRHDIKSSTGANVRQYKPVNRYKKAFLPYRGYEVTDSLSRAEVLANRGESAIVNLLENFLEGLKESMDQGMARQYFNDGNSNTEWWHGFESFFGTNGTINSSTGAQRASNAADLVAYPSDSYAGINTELSSYGGSQIDGVWPSGDAEPQRDFWTPLMPIADSTHTIYGSNTHTWAGQCDLVLGFAITHASRLGGLDAQPTTFLMDRGMFNDLKNKMRGKETIFVTRGNEDYSLVKLGFTNTIVVDGVECTFSNEVPVDTCYGFSYRNVQLRCQTANLFDDEGGVEYDRDFQAHKAVVSTISNLKFKSPRNFIKIFKSYANVT